GIASFSLDLEDGGVFLLYGIANMGLSGNSRKYAIDQKLAKVIANGISADDFHKLQAQVENAVVSRHASVAGIAESLAEAKTFFGDANEVNKEMDKYNAVSRADIQRVAKEYLGKEGRMVLYYLPKPADGEEIG